MAADAPVEFASLRRLLGAQSFLTRRAPVCVRASRCRIVPYAGEAEHLTLVRALVERDLSEPYSIYTYRYFINNWPDLTFVAYCGEIAAGCIVSKLSLYKGRLRGYIAMLTVEQAFRRRGLARLLVSRTIEQMGSHGCHEVVLETESTNLAAQRLYVGLGFVKDRRLLRYYLNGNDAFRLKLILANPTGDAASDGAGKIGGVDDHEAAA